MVWDIDWKDVWTGVILIVIGGVLTYIGTKINESRRRIRFSASDVYFGPALLWNLFMGRNYPSDDDIELECEIRFFSEKSETVGLHNFQMQFCRPTYMGPFVEFAPEMRGVLRDLDDENTPYRLGTLELPPRKWISLKLRTFIERKHWPALRLCRLVRLECKTSEGRIVRFNIGSIRLPAMPPLSIYGPEFMSVQIMPAGFPNNIKDNSVIIMAARRREGVQTNLFTIPAEDARYWTGSAWGKARSKAKVYLKPQDARADGEMIKIWNMVPEEWLPTAASEQTRNKNDGNT